MAYNWIDCHPADKDTAAMMAYTLKSCQDIKVYAVERISLGHRKPGGPVGGPQRGVEEWLSDFIHNHPAVTDVPRYGLRDALTGVWEDGIHKQMPYQKKEWNIFRVQPRAGWQKAAKVKTPKLSWDEYNAGKVAVAAAHLNTVSKDKTADLLFEEGKLRFPWGNIFFKRKALEQLNEMIVEKKWEREEFVANIKLLEFISLGTQGRWQVNFVWEKEKEEEK